MTDSISIFPIACILFALSIVVIALIVINRKQVKVTKQKQHQGLLFLLSLKQLLVLLQRHRGVSYSYLRGEESLISELNTLERDINAHLLNFAETLPFQAIIEHWQAFRDHWTRLEKNNLSLTPENNLEQHNKLIHVLLYLMEDIAEYAEFSQHTLSQDKQMWQALLRSAEWIGQARALGSGMIASGQYGSVERIRMSFLQAKLEECKSLHANNKSCVEVLEQLITIIKDELLENKAPNLSTKAYFQLASQAIETFMKHFDRNMETLKRQL